MEQAMDVLVAIVLACIPIVVPFVLKIIVAKAGVENYHKAMSIANTAVKAAEMLGNATGLTSEEKKAYAKKVVADSLKLSETQIDALIESAVASLKNFGEELGKEESV